MGTPRHLTSEPGLGAPAVALQRGQLHAAYSILGCIELPVHVVHGPQTAGSTWTQLQRCQQLPSNSTHS